MNEPTLRLCVNCANHRFDGFSTHECRMMGHTDVVTGESKFRPCSYARDALVGECGPDGELYVQATDATTKERAA